MGSHLWAPGGVNRGTVTLEARTRELGFDLRNHSGITIRGLNLEAASISMVGTSSSTIDAVTIRYPTVFVRVPQQIDWAPTPFDAGNSAGIFMSGTGNTVKNSYTTATSIQRHFGRRLWRPHRKQHH